jgi:hypothetical protein
VGKYEGKGWSTTRVGRFGPGLRDPVTIVEALCVPQGQSGRGRKISPPPEFDLLTVRSVARRYNDYAIPDPRRQKISPEYIVR